MYHAPTMDKNRHQRYLQLLKWFGKDILRSQWGKSVFLAICSFLSQLFQTTALAFALYYGGLIASHTPFVLFGITYDTHTSKDLLYWVALSVMVMFGVGVLFHYLSRYVGLGVRKNYTAHCATELIRSATGGTFGTLSAQSVASLTKIAKGNSVYCGRVANLIVLMIPELVITTISLVVLFYVEPALTLILGIVFMLSGVFIYRANVRAAKRSMLSDRYSPRARKSIRDALQNGTCKNQISRNEDFDRWLSSYVGKIRAVEEGALVVGLTTALLLAILLVGLVLDMMHDTSDWGRIVVYLVLFKVATTQLRKIVRRMVSINRFYPQTRVYWEVMTTNEIPNTLREEVDGLVEEDDED